MNNLDFISQLSKEVRPVEVVRKPLKNFYLLSIISFGWLLTGVLFIEPRHDVSEVLHDGLFWRSTLIIFLLAISSVVSSLFLSIPDKHHRSLYLIPGITALAWIGYIGLGVFTYKFSIGENGILCLRDIFLFSLLPTVILIRQVSRGSVLRTSVTGIFTLLGGAAIGAVGAQFTCQDDPGLHVLVWHLMPVFSLVLLGGLFGGFLFSSKKR